MGANSTTTHSKRTCLIIASIMIVATLSAHEAQAIKCPDVLKMVMPCLSYLKKGGAIPAACCAGVANLAKTAKTKADREQACVCIKPVAKSYSINYDLANKLPAACGVDYKINITPNIDCSKVKY